MVRVLNMLPTVEIDPKRLPRMADFAFLGEAVYRAHGHQQGAFLRDYADKREEGVHRTLEASPIAVAALAFLQRHPAGYEGTVKQLLETLTPFRSDSELWPRSARGFADALRRIAPALRTIGVNARISDKPGMHGYLCVLKRLISGTTPEHEHLVDQVHQIHEVHSGHEHDERHELRSELLRAADSST